MTAGSAQCHFANATFVSCFHFVDRGCSSRQDGLVEPRSIYGFIFVAKNHGLVVVRGQAQI